MWLWVVLNLNSYLTKVDHVCRKCEKLMEYIESFGMDTFHHYKCPTCLVIITVSEVR